MTNTSILPPLEAPAQVRAAETKRQLLLAINSDFERISLGLSDCLTAMRDASLQRNDLLEKNRDVLPSGRRQGEAFTLIESQMFIEAPLVNSDGRKLTVDERNAWLIAESRKRPDWQDQEKRLASVMAELNHWDLEQDIQGKRFQALLALLHYYTAALSMFKA